MSDVAGQDRGNHNSFADRSATSTQPQLFPGIRWKVSETGSSPMTNVFVDTQLWLKQSSFDECLTMSIE